jgi:hypothetical protein
MGKPLVIAETHGTPEGLRPEFSKSGSGARSGGGKILPPSMKAYILRRLMRREPMAQAISQARTYVESGLAMPKEIFEALLIETHRTCDWYAYDRVELLRLAKTLAERAGIQVIRQPLQGRQDSFVVSFSLPQGVVGWHVSAAQSDALGCVPGPALVLSSQTPEHLAFRSERIDAFGA